MFTVHVDRKMKDRLMKLTVDREADSLCLDLDESQHADSEEISPAVILDYNAEISRHVFGDQRAPPRVGSTASLAPDGQSNLITAD